MALYEVTIVTRPDLSKQDVDKLIEEFSGIVSAQGSKVVKEEYWGLRGLAYKINKNSKGHYSFLGLDASADALHELNRNLRINENVVRHLSVRVESISKEPSPVLRQQDRDAA